MVEMELNKIIIDEKRQEQIIVLKEKNGERLLPIVIGLIEANAIKMRIAGIHPPRPLTHDLLQSVIESLDTFVKRILIDKLEEGTYHAKLILASTSGEAKETLVDARPSDGIALSVRFKAPIFVAEEVLEKSAMFHQEK